MDVPLPMPEPGAPAVVGIDADTGQAVSWRAPQGLAGALRDMGLQQAVGFIRMMRSDHICWQVCSAFLLVLLLMGDPGYWDTRVLWTPDYRAARLPRDTRLPEKPACQGHQIRGTQDY